MEAEVLEHIFATQICSIYGAGKAQTTRVAAVRAARHSPPPCLNVPEPTSSVAAQPNPLDGGNLEDRDVHWFKTDFSRHVILANKDCELGDATNPWAFALLRYWLKAVFVPVNRRFTVLQSVLRACNTRIHAYFKAHPGAAVVLTTVVLAAERFVLAPRRAERGGLRRRARQAAPRWDAARGRKAAAGLGRRVGSDGLAAKLIPAER